MNSSVFCIFIVLISLCLTIAAPSKQKEKKMEKKMCWYASAAKLYSRLKTKRTLLDWEIVVENFIQKC